LVVKDLDVCFTDISWLQLWSFSKFFMLMTYAFFVCQGSVGLSTYLSLFVVWCISLCTSAVGSKDLPPPTLKLAAEEVSAVLHSAEPSKS
jgi:hypothetical protein